MAIQQRSEFASALNQVCSERGIEPAVVIDSIKQAILAAYRKDYEEPEGIEVEIDEVSGEVTLKKDKKIVTPPGFGRIAAQTAKQVILQRIREAEKEAIMGEYSSKVGTVVSGIIQRISGPIVTVSLGKAEGIMPPPEQARGEKYYVNQRLKFFIVGIKEGMHGEEIIVSRSANGLLEGLFKQEVPEMASGAVEVRAMAREAGSRSKIAVASGQLGVDPVGSCVGQKGVRVQAVINELGDEKIDVIAYQEDLAQFIQAALSPAKDMQVKIDEKTKVAEVTAPDDQLSLAIGKEGQNVRLAAKLTGYKIDIRGKSGTPKEVEAKGKAAQEEARKAFGLDQESGEPEKKGTEAADGEPRPEGREKTSAKSDQPADDQVQPAQTPAADDQSNPPAGGDEVPAGDTEPIISSDREISSLIADVEEKKAAGPEGALAQREEQEAEKVAEEVKVTEPEKAEENESKPDSSGDDK